MSELPSGEPNHKAQDDAVVGLMLSSLRAMRASIEEMHKKVDLCLEETRAARVEIVKLRVDSR